MIIPVDGIHDAKELDGAGDRLEDDVISAWERMNRAEYALVELFVVYNKVDAALAARLGDEKTRAAPSRRSGNLSHEVLLQQHVGDNLGFLLIGPRNSTCCGNIS